MRKSIPHGDAFSHGFAGIDDKPSKTDDKPSGLTDVFAFRFNLRP